MSDHEHDHEHFHEHTHTHEHADGTVHSHPHEHAHTHDHEHGEGHEHTHEHLHEHDAPHTHDHEHPHTHEHTHDHEHSHGSAAAQPMDQLYALMKYMAGHNADHTRELEGLAGKAREAGAGEAYDLIMEAVRFFDQGNESLSKALEKFPHA